MIDGTVMIQTPNQTNRMKEMMQLHCVLSLRFPVVKPGVALVAIVMKFSASIP